VPALSDLASPEALEAALATPGLLVLDIYTPSCVICRRLEPMVAAAVESVQASGGKVRAHKLDAERFLDFAARFDIRGVPSLLLFRDRRVIDRRIGFFTAADLRTWISAQPRQQEAPHAGP
jgi:thioredoxin-like negative regulator of GroEL